MRTAGKLYSIIFDSVKDRDVDSLDALRVFIATSDEELRENIYFLCGYRPLLMTEVALTIQMLQKEAREQCESSHPSQRKSAQGRETSEVTLSIHRASQGKSNSQSAKSANTGSTPST